MTRLHALMIALPFFASSLAEADTVKLVGGGSFDGKVLDEKSDDRVIVLQRGRGEIKIPRANIQEIIRKKTARDLYQEERNKHKDDLAGNLALAEWCKQHRLSAERNKHLHRVIELDPDHEKAREALGYLRFDGKWLTADQKREASGLIRYQGRYVTPQQKEILEAKASHQNKVRQWHKQVRMLKKWLDSDDRSRKNRAERQLNELSDPLALDAVVRNFEKEKAEERRILFCEILGRLAGDKAALELLKLSIADEKAMVRAVATEQLVDRQDEIVVKALMRALRHDVNIVVSRAAHILGELADPQAIVPLIEALVTTHKQVRVRSAPNSLLGGSEPQVVGVQTTSAPGVITFKPIVSYRTRGIGIGSRSQEIIEVPVENSTVLSALEAITGETFGFDREAWKRWYAQKLRTEDLRARRALERPKPRK